LVERFTIGRDPELDRSLIAYDALASAAHAAMLCQIGVLTRDDLAALRDALREVAEQAKAGSFVIPFEDEDGHTALENHLTRSLGDLGRRIHTGRSRNDQVIAALRLYGRDRVLDLAEATVDLAHTLMALAEAHRDVVMPGYTHTRQAMASTVGFLFAAHAEGVVDNLSWLEQGYRHLNRSPLGSASGYGVALALDRPLVARLLAFDRVQQNTLAVQNDRGKSEHLLLALASAVLQDLSRLASDLIWFSSDELHFFRLADRVTTGSSIMPQKRNPDVLELIRGQAARLRGRQVEVCAIYGSLPSGYHRDLQLTKEPFLAGMDATYDSLRVMELVLSSLTVDREACRAALNRAIGATDEVYRRVAGGAAFRLAYKEVAADPVGSVQADPAEGWRGRQHLGAPGAWSLDSSRELLAVAQGWIRDARKQTSEVWDALLPP
jgi:argininosuccinate lyase